MAAPWIESLDKQVDLYRFWESVTGAEYAKGFLASVRGSTGFRMYGSSDEDGGLLMARAEAGRLNRAETYWMNDDMCQVIETASKNMPSQKLQYDHLPTKSGFVWMEHPIYVTDRWGETCGVQAFRWGVESIGIEHRTDPLLAPFASGNEYGVSLSFYTCKYDSGDTYMREARSGSIRIRNDDGSAGMRDVSPAWFAKMPYLSLFHHTGWFFGRGWEDMSRLTLEDVEGEGAAQVEIEPRLHQFCAAFWAVVQQPIAIKTKTKPDRAAGKRAMKMGMANEIVVIRLRPAKTKYRDRDELPDEEAPYRTHRWLVRAHHRWQWKPSTQSHELIWIDEYVKGPEGAPLIVKDRVFRVDR